MRIAGTSLMENSFTELNRHAQYWYHTVIKIDVKLPVMPKELIIHSLLPKIHKFSYLHLPFSCLFT